VIQGREIFKGLKITGFDLIISRLCVQSPNKEGPFRKSTVTEFENRFIFSNLKKKNDNYSGYFKFSWNSLCGTIFYDSSYVLFPEEYDSTFVGDP